MRIVVDTNIWISGLLWRGKPWQLLRLAEDGKVEICIAYQMLLELTEVLAHPQFQKRLDLLGLTPQQLTAFAFSRSLWKIQTMTSSCCARSLQTLCMLSRQTAICSS